MRVIFLATLVALHFTCIPSNGSLGGSAEFRISVILAFRMLYSMVPADGQKAEHYDRCIIWSVPIMPDIMLINTNLMPSFVRLLLAGSWQGNDDDDASAQSGMDVEKEKRKGFNSSNIS